LIWRAHPGALDLNEVLTNLVQGCVMITSLLIGIVIGLNLGMLTSALLFAGARN
jgi:hypothetical protein